MFRKKPVQKQSSQYIPLTPQEYPVGTVVVTAKGSYLINSDLKRYRFISEQARLSWKHTLVVVTTEEALKNYPVAVTRLGY